MVDTRDVWFPMGYKQAIKNVCKWMDDMVAKGEWPNQRPFFNPLEAATIGRCIVEIEAHFLKGEEKKDE
jgi:hypothetical protein